MMRKIFIHWLIILALMRYDVNVTVDVVAPISGGTPVSSDGSQRCPDYINNFRFYNRVIYFLD